MASTRALGGLVAILVFIFALAAFVVQSSLTQYVQGTLGFRQPFFLLFIAHSSLMVIFPTHLLYLILTTRKPVKSYISSLTATIAGRLSPGDANRSEKGQFPTARFIVLSFALATGINIPGLLWYASVSLSSIGDVTALWNTNSFWVYVLTVWMYRMKWEFRKLGAVLLASIGVMLDVYGGSTSSNIPGADALKSHHKGPTAPVVGDVLTLVASISYALYQVLYKRYAALPNDSEEVEGDDNITPFAYDSLSEASDSRTSLVSGQRRSPGDENEETEKPPFGLYANFLTSCMGICTVLSLATGFPILHWLSVERFTLPPDSLTLWCVVAIAIAGVVFNSCFMILLGLWGPVLTSVGNLLTIVLVLLTDFLFNHESITLWSLLGSGMIVAAFGVLALDMIHRHK
ncbi:hypothetical protein JB92DRAFT_2788449 [Gautieria morchelliformis]|nr:hypothetical protein JB92DRAFT_2788449 [Gautieria morchelliformis]